MTNPNDLQARLKELDRLRRAHIRGLQLAAREIKQVVAAAVEAGIRLDVPTRPGRRRDGREGSFRKSSPGSINDFGSNSSEEG